MCVFFVFKQKTAYEMRISDWSSDVCSSDLHGYTLNQISPSTPPVGSPVDTVTFAVAMEPRPRFVRAVPALARSDKLEALVILPPMAVFCASSCACKIGRASCRERVCHKV